MTEASTPPEDPKYFPDMQEENRERTSIVGWYQNELWMWIQNQDPTQLGGMFLFGALTLIAGRYQSEHWPWIENVSPRWNVPFWSAYIAGWYQNELLSWIQNQVPWIQNQNPIQLVYMFLFGAITLIAGLYIIIIIIFLFLLICIEEFISNLSNLNLGSMQFEPESGDM